MTFSVLCISKDILIGKDKVHDIDRMSKLLHLNGGTLIDFSVLFPLKDKIVDYIQNCESDTIIIMSDAEFSTNTIIKNAVCDALELQLIIDKSLEKTILEYEPNIDTLSLKNELCLPQNASVLVNPYGYLQGWLLQDRKDIFFFENSTEVINYTLTNSVIPFLRKSLKKSFECTQIKMFGLRESDAREVLATTISNFSDIIFEFYQDYQILDLVLRYTSDLKQTYVSDCISYIYQKLRKFIVTNDDTSIYQFALDLLTISNRTLCLYETVTSGTIAQSLSDCKGVSKHLIQYSEIGFSPQNVINNLQLNPSIINQYGYVSVNVAYEIASILLDKTKCDIILVTLGDLENDNMCYTAVGDNDGIHIYKSKINSEKDAKKVLSDTAIFYLIKKLKQNDLYFNKIIV